ncbi:hypothetical protein [Acinetobacter baumannii]|uniref:hypothetical protein n=1 Tax=Acinetobacter baumannii TaxID=470 RepID=UPI00044ADC8D|nr:hypothetical protein [Acinetobacter baumannii]EXG73082.1 hypothetical protein J753_0200 [Acinetobacter baumannii 24812_10]
MSLIDLVYAFESATRAHENIGSQPLEDHAIIEEEFKSAKENIIVEIKERTNDPALAVIQYILSDNVDGTDDAMEFLNYWNEGEFDILRRNWNNIPDEVFIGADPLFKVAPPVRVGRHIEGVSINGLEYILDDSKQICIFKNEATARQCLVNNFGFKEEQLDDLVFEELDHSYASDIND